MYPLITRETMPQSFTMNTALRALSVNLSSLVACRRCLLAHDETPTNVQADQPRRFFYQHLLFSRDENLARGPLPLTPTRQTVMLASDYRPDSNTLPLAFIPMGPLARCSVLTLLQLYLSRRDKM